MKLNLLRNSPNILSGYTNVDPFGGESPKVIGDITNLDRFSEDAEASEIVATDVVDFLEPAALDRVVNHWLKKLRHKGTLTIGGVDLYDVSKALSSYAISVEDANRLLHGDQGQVYDLRKSNSSLPQMVALLESKGMKVLKKRVNGFKYIVVAERP